MLPEVTLDQERFEDMLREMQNMISSIVPEWTDYNLHDPGITMMELFAWLKGIQQFHMDQTGNGQIIRYLALLGRERFERQAAETLLEVSSDRPVRVPEGARFFAGKYCFETQKEKRAGAIKLLFCAVKSSQGTAVFDENQLCHGGRMKLYPFGQEKRPGTEFYLGLSSPVEPGICQELSVLVYEGYPVKRNPVRPGFVPLASWRCEYYTKDGWEALPVLEDETWAFLQSGLIRFRTEKEMAPFLFHGFSGWGIRFVLEEESYETAPIVTALSFDHVRAFQKRTRAFVLDSPLDSAADEEEWVIETGTFLGEHGEAEAFFRFGELLKPVGEFRKATEDGITKIYIKPEPGEKPEGLRILFYEKEFEKDRCLPDGDGFPFQKIDLGRRDILPESLGLMGEAPEQPGCFSSWSRVKDFNCSGPEDRHFLFEEETGSLKFGDGFHGLMPQGKLILSGCEVSAGGEGNIKQTKMQPEIEDVGGKVLARSLSEARGGRFCETFEEAFGRVLKELKEPERAVSLADYERMAMKTPGLMLESCRAIAFGNHEVYVAAMPWSEKGAGVLKKAAARNMERFLESKRMIGTLVRVGSPEYIQISVTMEIRIKPQYREGRALAEEAVRKFFRSQKERMGETLPYRGLYGAIDRLDCVLEVISLILDVRGNRFLRNSNKDVIPPADGVFLLKNLECIVFDE